jgi:hypothetical protein
MTWTWTYIAAGVAVYIWIAGALLVRSGIMLPSGKITRRKREFLRALTWPLAAPIYLLAEIYEEWEWRRSPAGQPYDDGSD